MWDFLFQMIMNDWLHLRHETAFIFCSLPQTAEKEEGLPASDLWEKSDIFLER